MGVGLQKSPFLRARREGLAGTLAARNVGRPVVARVLAPRRSASGWFRLIPDGELVSSADLLPMLASVLSWQGMYPDSNPSRLTCTARLQVGGPRPV